MDTALRDASASVGSLQSLDRLSDDLRLPVYSNARTDRYFIFVGSTILVLQPNLEEALRHLRYADRSRLLWIDALCINQKDDLERAKQVSEMGQIFESAASVQIWLGGACDNSDDAFRFIETLPQLTADLEPSQDNLHQEWIAFMDRHAPYGYFTMTTVNQLEALSYLVNRDWFYRRWVVQEVAFAKAIVVQCGRCVEGLRVLIGVYCYGEDRSGLYNGSG
ncbi:hypothetical protein BU25DRAFT_413551 [Macroventuria anomochaeta]|uniref:Uncharacterized protein n=1 Tax=Macroventuria anomochaeta TaxID=301207 RepID=A0ACB6RR75_9PLEO|nr:uncharacterized protein BU25DRAFT_413551 [Macroventuria anomochaeta]KAF2624289.1 hypothetical protein BU25DRAFT_413551 [Macroventuria anomochaeta]